MGYDYSLGYLARHQETVRQIVQVAQTGESLVFESEDYAKVRYRQQTVRSVLANMARNLKDYADIREKVRCWTEMGEEGKYRLYVGIPHHGVAGRPPKPVKMDWRDLYVSVSVAGGATYEHPNVITDEEGLVKFVGKVGSLPSNVSRATARFPQEVDVEAMEQMLSQPLEQVGWWLTVEPNGLTFTKVAK